MMHHSHLTNLDPSAKSAVLKTAVLVYYTPRLIGRFVLVVFGDGLLVKNLD